MPLSENRLGRNREGSIDLYTFLKTEYIKKRHGVLLEVQSLRREKRTSFRVSSGEKTKARKG